MIDPKPKPGAQSSWIVTDGAVGNEKQCVALAHYLQLDPAIYQLELRWPWNLLAPHGRWMAHRGVAGELRPHLKPPWPELIIGCGRRAALVSRWVRHQSRGATRTVQILDPRISPAAFDHVICPRHDRLEGDNVLQTEGALHCVDETTLSRFRSDWSSLAQFPQPRVAVFLGASNRACQMDRDDLLHLLERAAELAADGSLLVTTSRRTPDDQVEAARQWFDGRQGMIWTEGSETPNPYDGFLAWADRFVVSADSVNMISEALGTGMPVHSQTPMTKNPRFARFHDRMRRSGRLLDLDAGPVEVSYPPLRETWDVARALTSIWNR